MSGTSPTAAPSPALSSQEIREAVRQRYGALAADPGAGDCCAPSCCSSDPLEESGDPQAARREKALRMGYSPQQLDAVPEGANLGLGCGNPGAIAALKPGETVVDLGSGGGFDCFLAADQVGSSGRVIGVDMTAEMVAKARGNAARAELPQVEFRLGEIEHLPVADNSVDAILSNCVVNLSPDKLQVFRDAFRVLRPGGRLSISDIVAKRALPQHLLGDVVAHVGCVAGAASMEDLESMLKEAGFDDIRVAHRPESRDLVAGWLPGTGIEEYLVSATIEAVKPRA